MPVLQHKDHVAREHGREIHVRTSVADAHCLHGRTPTQDCPAITLPSPTRRASATVSARTEEQRQEDEGAVESTNAANMQLTSPCTCRKRMQQPLAWQTPSTPSSDGTLKVSRISPVMSVPFPAPPWHDRYGSDRSKRRECITPIEFLQHGVLCNQRGGRSAKM